jgi:2,3-dihydroxybenzoate decarboxylase
MFQKGVTMTSESSGSLAAGTSRRRLMAAAAGATAGTAALAAPAQAATSTSAGTAADRPGRGMKVIAVEEAFSVPELIPWPGEARMPPGWGQEWGRRLADFTELRLADMDEHGVDMQVLSLTSPGVEAIEDPSEAVATARRVNDRLADVVAAHPTRFAGFAALPLQDPKAAVVELRRAVEQLGLKGVLHNDHVLVVLRYVG